MRRHPADRRIRENEKTILWAGDRFSWDKARFFAGSDRAYAGVGPAPEYVKGICMVLLSVPLVRLEGFEPTAFGLRVRRSAD